MASPQRLFKIAVYLPRQLGDVLLGSTLPQMIKCYHPRSHVTWIVHPMAREIVEHHPDIDQVIFTPPKGFSNELQFVLRLRQEKFDILIDALNMPRTAWESFFSRAKKRISLKAGFFRDRAFHKVIDRELFSTHYLAHSRLHFLAAAGLMTLDMLTEKPLPNPMFHRPEAINQWAQHYMDQLKAETGCRQFVLISPTHRRDVRKWPGEFFVELGLQIISKRKEGLIWLWGPGQDDEVRLLHDTLQSRLKNADLPAHYSVFPEHLWSLQQTAAVSALAKGWVGNSNGLSHVAAAGPTKTIVIHGPTHPVAWTPPDSSRHRAVQRTQGCTRCEKNTCSLARRECLQDLTVKTVWEAVQQVF